MDGTREALQQSPTLPESGSATGGNGSVRAWPTGCRVRVRGRRWRVEAARALTDCHLLALSGLGRADRGRRVALLSPFDRPQRIAPPGGLRRVTWPQWLRALRLLVAGTSRYGRLATASAARIDLHAYQVEPSLALLNGQATRVLLADEVGLGKTIQAGLFVSELHARLPAPRSLILTPAGLRDQWAAELGDRFAIEATVVDAAAVRRALARLAAGTNPWAIWPVIVASLDFVKRPDVLRALDPFTWDTLVVDEAHQCATAPERSAAVRLLASRARHVLLLTATPHAGDDRAFEDLCNMGRLGRDDPIVMFRRSRSEVGIAHTRRVHLLRVRCSPAERRMHRLLDRYTTAVWASPRATADARLAMIVLRKRALSSAVALTLSLGRRLEALFDEPSPGTQMALPFAGCAEPDEQSPEDDEPPGCLAAPGMEGGRERAWLTRLLDAARDAARTPSKLRRLGRLLARVHQPAIVFTEYRDTARWLASALEPLGNVALLHGALARGERQEVERRFRGGQAQVLVATDAAGQGLNLHHRCRLVVNLELPWNPMRLEQRIGRVDRLGQARRPHAIHLVARDTAEEHTVRRLVVRQERARQRVGGVGDAVGATREEEVAAAVMAREPVARPARDGPPAASAVTVQPEGERAFRTIDMRALALEEVGCVSSARRLAGPPTLPCRDSGASTGTAVHARRPGSFDSSGPEAGVARRRWLDFAGAEAGLAVMPRKRERQSALSPGLLCVFIVRGTDAAEEVLDESLVAVHLALAPAPGSDASRAGELPVRARVGGRGSPVALETATIARVGGSEALKKHALAYAASRSGAAFEAFRRVTANALRREGALRSAEHGRAPLQPGMFDRRAVVEAEREAAVRGAREGERTERVSMLRARLAGSLAWRAELALVLVIPEP